MDGILIVFFDMFRISEAMQTKTTRRTLSIIISWNILEYGGEIPSCDWDVIYALS